MWDKKYYTGVKNMDVGAKFWNNEQKNIPLRV